MSREGIGMRKVKEILRLNESGSLSQNAIAKSCNVASSTVGKVLRKAKEQDIEWPLGEGAGEECQKLMESMKDVPSCPKRAMPDMEELAGELRRKGVTRRLLWEEYRQRHPDGYSYSQFCNIFGEWSKGHVEPTMRFEHKAGAKMFVDWAGDKLRYSENGEEKEGHLFIATLGASNYTYVGVYPDEKLSNWIQGHVDAYKYFGGVSLMTVPDNPKTAVRKTDPYDPELNPAYYEMAEHFGTAIMPARPGKPRDKAKVENAVLFAERWVIGALRNRQFLSFGELRAEVEKRTGDLNKRPFGKMDGNREKLFFEIEKNELKPLPEREFSFGEWRKATVHIDYHIQVDNHYYSVPYRHIGKTVEARLTGTTVEVFRDGARIALHQRSYAKSKATTLKEHLPPAHNMFMEENTGKIVDDAAKIGASCGEVVTEILARMPRPEMGYRSCLGIIRLAKKHSAERLEKACGLALKIKACRYRNIAEILEKNRENESPRQETINRDFSHRNVRGGDYYRDGKKVATC